MRALLRCAAPPHPPCIAPPCASHRSACPPHTAARPRPAQLARRTPLRSCVSARRGTSCAAADSALGEAETDAEARAALNDVSSRAIRVMLAGDASGARALREELQATSAELAGLGMAETAEDELFLTLVAEMLDHTLLPGADALGGDRSRAFFAILAAVEGEWRLLMPGQQADGPPEANLKYETYEEVVNKRRQQRFGPQSPPPAGGAQPRGAPAAAPDAWALLGVERGASKAEIKAAYRQKALELHPDVSALPDATALFAAVAAAYEQLTSDSALDAEGEVDSWAEFARTPKKESSRSAARKAPSAGESTSADPQVGDLVEYPLPARERSGGRVAGVALLVSRNCDRGDAKTLPPASLDICECEPLRQREPGGNAWVPDELAAPCFPRMGELRVLDRSAITYLTAHDAWAFALKLSPGCSGPEHDEEIML